MHVPLQTVTYLHELLCYMYIVLTSIDNRKLTLDYGMVMLHFLIITHFYTVSDSYCKNLNGEDNF